jgi:Mn2+/Fe2+ NRAMP family transporter
MCYHIHPLGGAVQSLVVITWSGKKTMEQLLGLRLQPNSNILVLIRSFDQSDLLKD